MADSLDYRFGAMQQTNESVQQGLSEFGSTLESFKTTYTSLAQQWGGAASQGAVGVAQSLDQFGNDVRDVVQNFLKVLREHLDASVDMEKRNTNLFG